LRLVTYPDLPPFVNDQKMKLRRPALAAMLAYWTWLIVGYSTESNAADRPNIIVILADDFGYGSTNAYGADKSLVQTPALDRLAAEGKRFTHAYTASSVCSPTRYALMTGRYAWRTSLQSGVLNPFAPLHIGTDQLNVASLLKKQQYKTAAVGKWHLGLEPENHPNRRTKACRQIPGLTPHTSVNHLAKEPLGLPAAASMPAISLAISVFVG
jgi:arylsulfatase A-like enzyme